MKSVFTGTAEEVSVFGHPGRDPPGDGYQHCRL